MGMKNRSYKIIINILILLILCSLSWYFLYNTRDKEKLSVNKDYEGKMALQYLNDLTKYKRPIGTKGNNIARKFIEDTLEKEGVQVTELKSFVTHEEFGPPLDVGITSNVLGCVPGRTKDSILIVAHYDSVPSSKGVGDNGLAVANMLQIAVEYSKQERPRNNLLFLFTDGEEIALLGSKAFLDNNFAQYNIKAIINLEGRGDSGIPLIFEPTDKSIEIVHQYASKTDFSVSSSVFNEFYKFLPFKSDYTVLKEHAPVGFNIAFIDGFKNYHNVNDNINNLNHGTAYLQYLTLTKFINITKNQDLSLAQKSNDLFWTISPGHVLFYPSWMNYLFLIVMILFFILSAKINGLPKLKDFLYVFIFIIGIPISGYVFIKLFQIINPFLFASWRLVPLNNDLISIGSSCAALIAALIILICYKERRNVDLFSTTVLCFISIFSLVCQVTFPTFVLPLFLLTLPFFISDIIGKGRLIDRNVIFLLISFIPFAYSVYTCKYIYLAIPKYSIVVLNIFPGFILGYLILSDKISVKTTKRLALLVVSVLVVIAIVMLSSTKYTSEAQHPSSLYLFKDLEKHDYWITEQNELDEWQKRIFKNDDYKVENESFFFGVKEEYKMAQIKNSNIPLSNIKVKGVNEENSIFQINISENNYNAVYLLFEDAEALHWIEINDRKITKDMLAKSILEDKILLRIWNSKEVNLRMKLDTSKMKGKIKVLGMNFGHMIDTPKLLPNTMEAWPGYMTYFYLNNIYVDKFKNFRFEKVSADWQ